MHDKKKVVGQIIVANMRISCNSDPREGNDDSTTILVLENSELLSLDIKRLFL